MLDDFHRAYDALLDRWPVDVDQMTVESGRGSIRLNVCGPPGAPPVVLLAGAGATSTVWFANVEALSRHLRVVAVDVPGDAGRSVVRGALTLAHLIDWLDEAIRAVLGPQAIHVVGHSYGAQVALAFALRRPDRCASLILLDPNGCFAGTALPYLFRALPGLVRPSARRAVQLIDWEVGPSIVPDADWLGVVEAAATTFPVRRLVIPRRPTRVEVGGLSMPVTIAFARNSRVHNARRVADRLRRDHPRFVVETVDEASHHSLPSQPSGAIDGVIARAIGRAAGA